jgi:alginate O-acetyltransferase complex protein AlgI
MVFSSSIFLTIFLPAFLLLYWICPKKLKNPFLLLSSVFFYAWGAPKFIFVIIGTTLIDFFLVGRMDRSKNEAERKALLVFSVVMNLGLLVYFKYMNFFIENVNVAMKGVGLESSIPWTKLVLPIGISFYTFETLTYVVDVFRRVHKPLKNFWDYQLYIILFPKLIAGPIIRYHDIADQIPDRSKTENSTERLLGFYRFCIGLGKKVLIANALAAFADSIYGSAETGLGALDPNTLSMGAAWLAALSYTFQIYFDFSGYSDMAIGIGRMVGFKFPENFNNPYVSQNITEFWRRWHMTLGGWMRNYLYIPLGGNKVGKGRLYFNLWLVFLLSGLWHGASWNYIIWGAWHGLFLVLERAFLIRWFGSIGKITRVALTFVVVVIGWVFFRVEDLNMAWRYVGAMFSANGTVDVKVDSEWMLIAALATVFSFFLLFPKTTKFQDAVFGQRSIGNVGHLALTIVSAALFVLSLSYITASGFNPFIYFRF